MNMKLLRSNKQKLLVIAGLLIIAVAQIITHYIDSQDSITGIISGLGIGLLIGALFQKKHKSTI